MAEETNAAANAVTLKLPAFWTSQPQVWFQQAEAQFTIRNITADQTKYAYIVAALNHDTAGRLLDLLRAPPTEGKYAAIKARLTKTFGLTRRVRANRLLQMGDLGDRRPSALMDEMLSLLDGHSPCMLFEQLFLNRMPDPIHLQLAEADFTDPRRVAEHADELWLAMGPNNDLTIHRVAKQRYQGPATKQTGRLTAMQTGAFTTVGLVTKPGNVCNPASFRKTPRPAATSDGGRPKPNTLTLCLGSPFWVPLPGGHRGGS